jgi:hypothetical protein
LNPRYLELEQDVKKLVIRSKKNKIKNLFFNLIVYFRAQYRFCQKILK